MIGSLTEFMVPVVYLFTVAALAIGFLWLMDKLFRRPMSKAEVEEQSRRFRQRLLAPDFPAAEAHFRAVLPDALKRLYADENELLRSDKGEFEVLIVDKNGVTEPWYVAIYVPIDAQSLKETWPGCEAYLAFADDGCGNGYLIKPGTADPPVVFHDHESGEVVEVSPSLSAFLAAPKRNSE